MADQKFHRGDYVISADHRNPGEAVVLGSYYDQYGGSINPVNGHGYTLLFAPDGGRVSWFYEPDLTWLRHVGESGIAEIEAAAEARRTEQSDLGWILKNWPRLRDPLNMPGASANALMAAIGITEPWGKHGEGMTWYSNAMATISNLREALDSGDMGVLEAAIANTKATRARLIEQAKATSKAVATTRKA